MSSTLRNCFKTSAISESLEFSSLKTSDTGCLLLFMKLGIISMGIELEDAVFELGV